MFCMVVSQGLWISILNLFINHEIFLTERKVWVYGKSLQLKWGDISVRPCEDKWVFVLEIIP